jgi:CheY-like chemotaxis protein
VLVVDDNVDAGEMLASLLRLDGHEVRTASDAVSALAIVENYRPDVALLDIGLPGMSGYDLARRLRADRRLAGTTLVAVTGWGQEEDRRQSRDVGIHHHLTKPVDPAAVQKIVAGRR